MAQHAGVFKVLLWQKRIRYTRTSSSNDLVVIKQQQKDPPCDLRDTTERSALIAAYGLFAELIVARSRLASRCGGFLFLVNYQCIFL